MWTLIGFILPLIFIFIFGAYRLIRKKCLVNVKCWFCSTASRVIYEMKNSWDCPQCEQYNGFTEDGDFNKVIPEMHDERLNRCVETSTIGTDKILPKPDVISLISPNGLCYQCNQNQLLKVRQLANFVPSCEDKFDEEIIAYRSRLEQIYALCVRCRTFVGNELAYQNQKFGLSEMLLSSNLKRLHPKSVATFVTNASKNTFTTSKTIWKKKRRSVGNKTAVLMLLSSIVVASIWLSDLHNVQCDSQTEIIVLNNFFPLVFMKILPKIYSHSSFACFFGFMVNSLMIYFCKARHLATDYIGILFWTISFVLHAIDVRRWTILFGGKEDLYVFQFCSSTCLTLVVVWSCVLPRRRLVRKSDRKGHSSTSSPNQSTFSDCGLSQRSAKSSNAGSPTLPGKYVNMKLFSSPERHSPSSDVIKSPWRQELPDLFTQNSSIRTREGSPSRVLGAKLSTLSLRSTSPTKSNFNFSTSSYVSPSFRCSSQTDLIRSRQKNNSILAPPKFTVTPTSTNLWSSTHHGTSKTNQRTNETLQFWWNKNDFTSPTINKTNAVGSFCQPDEDTVSLLSGFSTTTSKRLASPKNVAKTNADDMTTTTTKSNDFFWKILIGFVLVFSLSTNLAVLYHVFMKK